MLHKGRQNGIYARRATPHDHPGGGVNSENALFFLVKMCQDSSGLVSVIQLPAQFPPVAPGRPTSTRAPHRVGKPFLFV
jgi:hypothetical protein